MQSSVEFRNPFTYTETIITVFLILIVAIVVFLIVTRKRKKKVEVVVPPKKDVNSIKKKYLEEIDNLIDDTRNNKINYRTSYTRLSKIIREFIFEVTSINVTSVSLAEVKHLNMPYLYELMKEYYVPEFAHFFKGDIENSIEKTRGVITKWK